MKFCIIDDSRCEPEYRVEVITGESNASIRERIEYGGEASVIAIIDTEHPAFDPTKHLPKEVFTVLESLANVPDSSFRYVFNDALAQILTAVLNEWRKYEKKNRDELIRVEQAREQLDNKP